MQHLVAISLLSLLLIACEGSGPSAPPAPIGNNRPPLLERFAATRGGDDGQGSEDPWIEPATLDDLFFASGDTLVVEAGRLEGQIGEVPVAAEADEHLGYMDEFDGFKALMATVSARTDRGVAMLIVNVDQGFDSPLFTDGYLEGGSEPLDVEELDSLSIEELQELFFASSVMGCSGDSLAEITFDEMASQFELLAQQDIEDPARWTIATDVEFIDPYSGETHSASGRFDIVRPD